MRKPTEPGMGLTKPTAGPPEAGPADAQQPAVEPSARSAPEASEAAQAASLRSEKAISDLRHFVEEAASSLEALQNANRILVAELAELRRQPDRREHGNSAAAQEIATLEAALEESRRAAILERERAAHEREQIFERQDEFLAALLEERQSSAGDSKPSPEAVHPPSARKDGDSQELERLRQTLDETQRKLARLETERERSRGVLRRLQQQRDDAQRTVKRLTQESRKQTRPPRSDDGTASSQQDASTAGPEHPPQSAQPSEPAPTAKQHGDDPSSANRSDARSPLAAALANSDPSRRRNRRTKR